MYINQPKFRRRTTNLKKLVIAIDGPAASGKSTTARLIAEQLGYLYIDTGAMYRAMTLKVLQRNLNPNQEEEIARLAEDTSIRLERDGGGLKVFLDNQDVTQAIRSQAVTRGVSSVSTIKKVRDVMVREQRRMGASGGIVVEGRDIGTVVFPNADLKVFMVANVEERARRRQKDLRAQGADVPLQQLMDEIIERDWKDSHRDISPLRRADDAVVLDTSSMTIEQQVKFIVERAKSFVEKHEGQH